MFSKLSAAKQRLLERCSHKVLYGAAGAIGAAVVGFIPLVYEATVSHFGLGRERLVGILSEPDDASAATPVSTGQNGNHSCAQDTTSVGDRLLAGDQLLPKRRSAELWFVDASGGDISAHVDSEDGSGHGKITGYRMLRDGEPKVDTLTAAFKGATVGRGFYYLERTYRSGSAMRDREWWRGIHVEYDCDRGRTLKCPYVLGSEKYRNEMVRDSWLEQPCTVELIPSNPTHVGMRREASALGKSIGSRRAE